MHLSLVPLERIIYFRDCLDGPGTRDAMKLMHRSYEILNQSAFVPRDLQPENTWKGKVAFVVRTTPYPCSPHQWSRIVGIPNSYNLLAVTFCYFIKDISARLVISENNVP